VTDVVDRGDGRPPLHILLRSSSWIDVSLLGAAWEISCVLGIQQHALGPLSDQTGRSDGEVVQAGLPLTLAGRSDQRCNSSDNRLIVTSCIGR
jgi:hypothetical protein